MKLFDRENNRLALFEEMATSGFWDKHWQVKNFAEAVRAGADNRFIRKVTKEFLPPGSKVLEGGSGTGSNVYGLKSWGYDAYGVDFAEDTVRKIKEDFPELQIFVQDVRHLDFPDAFFDGYWSLGVIEHFWEGYEEIISEAGRVVRNGGYLFLSFPYMSPLRKLKSRMGLYKGLDMSKGAGDFYQFMLDAEKVKDDVEKHSFSLQARYSIDATKGIKDEVALLKPVLQKIYDSHNIFAKGMRFMNSILFSSVAAHSILLVFRKNEK